MAIANWKFFFGRDHNGSEPWACGDCDCTARLEQKLQNTGKSFLEILRDSAKDPT